jgi:peptide/nickel transport system substrate-binding protein
MHIRNRLISLAAAGLAAGLVLAACGGGDEAEDSQGFEDCAENPNTCNSGEAQDGGSITYIISQPMSGWNLISPEGGSVYGAQGMFGVLPVTGYDLPDGEYQFNMDLLTEDPVLLTEEPWQYQFKLSQEAVWNDGTPITVDDFLVTWYMSTAPAEGWCDECRSRSSGGADQIESIEGSDGGKTVTVTLKEGQKDLEYFGDWGQGSVSSGIYPAHIATEQGFDWQDPAELGEYFEWLNETVPTWSGGPYQIVEGGLDTEIIKEPNEQWYGEPVQLDTVVHRFMTDAADYITAYNNGEIHGGSPPDMDRDVIEQLRGIDNVRVDVGAGPSWEHLDINLKNTQLAEVELRRAIFTAIDANNIATRNFGDVFPEFDLRRNYSFKSDHDYFQDVVEETGFGDGDLEEARAILATAGYEGYEEGAGPLTLDGEQIGPFRLRSTDTEPRTTSLALIQDDLSQIGIEANIELTDALGETLSTGDYDLMQFGWSGSPAFFTTNAHQYGHTESANNFGKYSNPDYDALAEQAQAAGSLEESAELTNQAYELMVPDAYILPLYDSPVYIFVHEDYVNVRDNLNLSLRGFYNMAEWGVSTAAE